MKKISILIIPVLAGSVLLFTACKGLFGKDTVFLVGSDQFFKTIQSAIDAAESGQEIIVLPGTYTESVNFNGKDITLRSATLEELIDLGSDINDTYNIVEATIINGGGSDVIIIDSGSEREAVFRCRFTLILK